MKRLLFVVLMMVYSVSWAEWKFIGKTDEFADWIDKSKIRRNGKIAKMWVLSDYVNLQTDAYGFTYKSIKRRWAYNCMEETTAVISIIVYSDSMGGGTLVHGFELKENEWYWASIIPGSSAENLFKIACAKK
jgi:hypothetical protein